MKKQYALKILLAAVTLVVHVSAHISVSQQQEVQKWFESHGPSHISQDVRTKLDLLREDLAAFQSQRSLVTLLTRKQLELLSESEKEAYVDSLKKENQRYQAEERPILLELCKRHDLELIADNHSFVFLLRSHADWWVIRMRKIGYPIPFQTLSRIAYVHEIQGHITENNLHNIIPPQAFFYNLHGEQSYDEEQEKQSFNDTNWIVIERYSAGLPSPTENKKSFEKLKS